MSGCCMRVIRESIFDFCPSRHLVVAAAIWLSTVVCVLPARGGGKITGTGGPEGGSSSYCITYVFVFTVL